MPPDHRATSRMNKNRKPGLAPSTPADYLHTGKPDAKSVERGREILGNFFPLVCSAVAISLTIEAIVNSPRIDGPEFYLSRPRGGGMRLAWGQDGQRMFGLFFGTFVSQFTEFQRHYPHYKLGPYLDLFLSEVSPDSTSTTNTASEIQDLKATIRYFETDKEKIEAAASHLNEKFNRIRESGRNPAFRERLKKFQFSAQENRRSLMLLSKNALDTIPDLRIAYFQMGADQLRIARAFAYAKLRDFRKSLLKYLRTLDKTCYRGYALMLEHDIVRGYVLHALVYLHDAALVQAASRIPLGIKQHWETQITSGEGTAEFWLLDAPHSSAEQYQEILTFTTFLTEKDFHFRLAMPNDDHRFWSTQPAKLRAPKQRTPARRKPSGQAKQSISTEDSLSLALSTLTPDEHNEQKYQEWELAKFKDWVGRPASSRKKSKSPTPYISPHSRWNDSAENPSPPTPAKSIASQAGIVEAAPSTPDHLDTQADQAPPSPVKGNLLVMRIRLKDGSVREVPVQRSQRRTSILQKRPK